MKSINTVELHKVLDKLLEDKEYLTFLDKIENNTYTSDEIKNIINKTSSVENSVTGEVCYKNWMYQLTIYQNCIQNSRSPYYLYSVRSEMYFGYHNKLISLEETITDTIFPKKYRKLLTKYIKAKVSRLKRENTPRQIKSIALDEFSYTAFAAFLKDKKLSSADAESYWLQVCNKVLRKEQADIASKYLYLIWESTPKKSVKFIKAITYNFYKLTSFEVKSPVSYHRMVRGYTSFVTQILDSKYEVDSLIIDFNVYKNIATVYKLPVGKVLYDDAESAYHLWAGGVPKPSSLAPQTMQYYMAFYQYYILDFIEFQNPEKALKSGVTKLKETIYEALTETDRLEEAFIETIELIGEASIHTDSFLKRRGL